MSLRTRAAVAAACASCLFVSLPPSIARGADAVPMSCASAYENAQLYRQRGKLIEAREAALVCSRPSCPEVGRQDCGAWVGEIQREIPTIVVAQDEYVVDERNARVVVDGVERAEGATGRAFEVNPGEHVLRVERAGFEPVERTIVVVQGERDRIVRFSLRALAPAQPPLPSPAPAAPLVAPEAPPGRSRSTYLPALVVGGASAAALGVSAWLGLSGRSDLSTLRSTCAPGCTDDQVDPVRRKLIASDVVLAVGAVGAVVSAYLFVRPPSAGPALAPRISVFLAPGGAAVSIGAAL